MRRGTFLVNRATPFFAGWRSQVHSRYLATANLTKDKFSLDITSVHRHYMAHEITPKQIVTSVVERLKEAEGDNAWICQATPADMFKRAEELQKIVDKESGGIREVLHKYPLFGVPFSVKDNIDVAGYNTTAACPDYSYSPSEHSPPVAKVLNAGGIFVGKTNMDQFATGLVGVRSPYGVPRNPFSDKHVPGGSSSGSAVSVSTGTVSFSLATDTAGSGRVPASFNNLVGLKPTRGMLSNTGMVPACRSLDCMSIYALSCDDAWHIYEVAKGYDERDEYSRREPPAFLSSGGHYYHNFGHILTTRNLQDYKTIRFGIPSAKDLKFFGDTTGQEELFRSGVERIAGIEGGIKPVEIDYGPWTQVAKVLYDGPWISERLSGIKDFYEAHPKSVWPTTDKILKRGYDFTAVDTFNGMRHLERLRRITEKNWDDIDVLIVPTASVFPTIAEVEADPININQNLGYYTNFLNLLDLCALALPSGFLPSGLPAGLTIIAPAFNDSLLYRIGQLYQQDTHLPLGATGHYLPPKFSATTDTLVPLAVVGAHLSGQPLNTQLTALGAVLLKSSRTAPSYKLVDIDTKKPGLFKVGKQEKGGSIELEVWGVPTSAIGGFLENVRAPLGIGNIDLVDGSSTKGFICEEYAAKSCKDITKYGGWRAYKQAILEGKEK